MPRSGAPRIDWGKQENTERLLAAILAAQGMKMDYHRVAKMFGYGATYSSIEGQLRKSKRIAATLPDDDDMKKSEEEIDITDDDDDYDDDDETENKETLSNNTHLTPASARVSNKRSARRVQSCVGLLSDEIVLKEKKKIEMAGKKVVGGRVKKGSRGPTVGRKKAKGEDEVKVIEIIKLE